MIPDGYVPPCRESPHSLVIAVTDVIGQIRGDEEGPVMGTLGASREDRRSLPPMTSSPDVPSCAPGVRSPPVSPPEPPGLIDGYKTISLEAYRLAIEELGAWNRAVMARGR